MATLNQSSINSLPSNVVKSNYDRTKLKAGIIHFGVGAFHRSHQALYLDQTLAKSGSTEWGLIGVGLLSFDIPMRDAMKQQDSLYTVNEMSPDGKTTTRLIQAMIDYVYGPDDWDRLFKHMTDPNIKIVSLTITEGGYLMNNKGEFMSSHPSVVKDLATPEAPTSAFGIIIESLRRRRAANIPAFTVMSCDNLRHNGDQAKKACLAFAKARDADLASWIESHVTFPNGMVDRITPATDAALRDKLNAISGVNDKAPVVAEDFIQWVLEDNFKYGRPSFESVGVTITDNVTPYEEAKIRLLNASHQMVSYPAFLAGERRVDIACQDPLFQGYLRDFLNKDSGPYLQSIPGMDLEQYKETLLKRFANSAIADQLARLCLDGGSKIPGFLLPTIKANLTQHGTCRRIAYLLACYNHYIHVKVDDNGEAFELREPNALALLEPIIASQDPMALIKETQLVGDAANYPQFVKDYLTCYDHVKKDGARKTLINLDSILSA